MPSPMKTNSPTHEEIAERAHEIWRSWGNPGGRDTEIWLEAERQLAAGSPGANSNSASGSNLRAARNPESPVAFGDRIKAETVVESEIEYLISPAIPDEDAVKAAMQAKEPRESPLPGKATRPATSAPLGRDHGSVQTQDRVTTPDPNIPAPTSEHPSAPTPFSPSPDEAAAQVRQQKHDARAPHLPAKSAPKAAASESGKPLWDKPHSR